MGSTEYVKQSSVKPFDHPIALGMVRVAPDFCYIHKFTLGEAQQFSKLDLASRYWRV